ncbi:MAG: ABC transporter ATP-binding protein [Anaerolineae bacterium]|nr:ABC transporter ATP-binding protein [Anaerolineae bacterium]
MMRGGPMMGMDIKEEKAQDTAGVARRLLGYAGALRGQLIWVVVAVLVSSAMRLYQPYLIGVAFDQFIAVGDRAGLTRTMLLLLMTYGLSYSSNVVSFLQMAVLGQELLYRLRADIFARLQRLPLGYFDTHEIGDLMSRLTNDTNTINQFIGAGLSRVIGDVLSLVGIVIVMLSLNWRLALASFTVLPIMWVFTTYFSGRARKAFRETRKELGKVNAELEENIAGMREVQAFARERTNQARFSRINARNRDANVGANAITSAFMPAVDIISTLATAIVVGYGAYLALNNQVTIGTIVAFLTYVQRFFEPVRSISQMWTLGQSALAGGERIFALIDEPVELEDKPDAQPMPQIQGRVQFDHVTFGYKPGQPVLHDVNLEAQPGQTVALVGPTGAGKSSIVNLLMRFYDAWEGAVRVDGIDVRDVQRGSLRRQMGMVLQDTFLFSGTIGDNIRYGRPEATDEEVEAAARLVNAHDFISRQPDGYKTPILERGANLSQGQKQLIAFARAVLADPRILILDEATSSVDTRTEALIQDALHRLLAGRTAFVIAHRLSTIRNADQVLVVKDGRIVERGTHDSLMAQGGVYAELVSRQLTALRQNGRVEQEVAA